MPTRKNNPGPTEPAARENPAGKARRRKRDVVRRLAHTTLFAAGLAMARLTDGNDDADTPLFNATLVDRLRVTITRYHE